MIRKSFALVCLLFVAGLFLSGCGSIQSASVAVTASGTTVDATDAVTLSAVVTHDTNSAGVTWTVSGGGTLSNTTTTTATYTAPAASSTALTVTVTATSVADATKTGTATITVPAKPAITTGALAAGTVGTAYSATMAGSGGISPYTWTMTSGTLPAGLTMNSAGVISGTPTATGVGTTNLTFLLTDSGSATKLTSSVTLGLTVNAAPSIGFTGSVPATATYNLAYTGSAAAGGGAGALTYTMFSGALPTGLGLNAANGAITGTPTATGTFNFTIKAADAFGDSLTQGYSIVVTYPAVVLTPATLPTGYVQSLYHSSTLTATGGSGNGFTFALANGTVLPLGLNLSAGGVISGTPTATGTVNFTVKATDSASNSGTGNFSITVNAGVSITTGLTLPIGYVGSNYSQALAATGGSGSGYTWAITSGSNPPAGLGLSTGGVLSGKPTTTGTPSFSITATDSVGNTASATFSMTVSAGVSIVVPTLPTGYPGTVYPGATLTASGGTNTGFTWSWAAASGSSLPAGLTIGSTTGAIAGTPTNATSASVVSSVVVTATDSVGNQATTTISITIEASVAITTTTLPGATIGVSYSQPLAASGGSGSYTSWQVTTGAASLTGIGLSLNTSTGVISGATPTSGTATFSVDVTDSQGHVSTAVQYTVVASSALVVTTSSLNPLNVGQTPAQVMAAAGGSGIPADYSWSWTAAGGSSLPPGLTMGTTGAIGGSPTTAGTYNVVVKVQDSGSSTSNTANLSITINSALSLSANTLAAGYTGVAYTGTISASGGSGSYCFTVPTAAQYTAGIWDGLQTFLPNLPPSGGCNYLGGSSLSLSGTPTSTPTPPYTISLSISVTDETTGQTITRPYTISVTAPSAPSLPASSLAAGTVNQTYSGSVTATGGLGPNYTWTINGTALATNGSLVSVGDGLSVSNSGTNVLLISGSPTSISTSPGVQFTAQVKDTTTGLTSGAATTYTIVVNSAGTNVSGQIALSNNCGSVTVPTITVNLLTNPGGAVVQTQTTDTNGNYTFTSIPNGNYTISPSITGPSSAFYPATTNVTVNNTTLAGENFQVTLGYSVSGTVSYGGLNTGRIYLSLNNNNCGGNGGTGTSIAAPGAFTIRGVPPGSYNLNAYMDLTALGNGTPNTSDPTGSTAGLTISTASLTGQTLTLTDNTPSAVPTINPTFQSITPTDQGVVISFKAAATTVNNNKVEVATSYDVQFSTSSTFATSPVIHNFKAIGSQGANVWILNNGISGVSSNPFSNGTPYYFEVRSRNSVGPAATWTVYGGGTPTSVTPGASTTGIEVQGTVTVPGGVTPTGPLYAGFYNQNTNTVYGARIASPTAGANNYTIYVPSDSNLDYINFAILDQNNDGLIDAGDVSNTDNNNASGIAITAPLTGQDPPLPTVNSTAQVTTNYYQSTSSGGSSSGYNLNFTVNETNKLPVAVTLTSGPNMVNPIDIAACTTCGNPQFNINSSIGSAVPTVGDTYTFTVTYSDGSQDTGSTVNGKVTAFGSTGAIVGASELATNLSPNGTSSTSLTPTLSWTYPAGASTASYAYSFYMSDNNGNTIWQLPNQSSDSNGFTYAQIPSASLTWGVDPIAGDNSSLQGSLNTGIQYTWQIQVQDSLGNSAQTQTWYKP